jgi:hypothetical protein
MRQQAEEQLAEEQLAEEQLAVGSWKLAVEKW